MTPSILVLFDVDGTLIWPDGLGRASMHDALHTVFQTAGPIESLPFNGKTDRYITSTLMTQAGVHPEDIDKRFEEVRVAMIDIMQKRIEQQIHDVQPCPGAHDLVRVLKGHDHIVTGLLTGNFKETAHLKIQAASFDPADFPVGAYGGESANRDDLPALAANRAAELTGGTFQGKKIVIIGDTPADVTCGRGVGARSIAVLTGWSDRAIIEAEQPDFIFEDLTDTEGVLAAILAD